MPVKSLNIDLLPVLRKIPFVKKGLLTSTTVGAYKSVFKGRGLEFAGYRPYSTTDDASLIELKAQDAADVVASLYYTMLEAKDNKGMVLFKDRITATEYPNCGRQQYRVK